MNGPVPIFPLNALGQPAAALPGAAPAGEEAAFAETLTAALSASTQTAVASVQQAAEAPTTEPKDSLTVGLSIAPTLAIDGVGQTLGNQATELPTSLFNLHDETGASAKSANPLGVVTEAQNQNVEGQIKEKGRSGPRAPELVAAEVQGGPLGSTNAQFGDRAPDGLPATPTDHSAPIVRSRQGLHSIQRPADATPVAAPLTFRSVDQSRPHSDVPLTSQPLTGLILDQEVQIARSSSSGPGLAAETRMTAGPQLAAVEPARLTPASGPVSSPDPEPVRTPQASLHPDIARKSSDTPAASVNAHKSSPVPPIILGQAEASLLSPGRSNQAGSAEPLAAQPKTTVRPVDFGGFAELSRSSGVLPQAPAKVSMPAAQSRASTVATSGSAPAAVSESVVDDRAEPSAPAPSTSGRASTPAAAAGGPSPLTPVAEASVRPTNESGGPERLQALQSPEAVIHDAERFEPMSSGSLRPQSTAAASSAGTQVALQIVRSIPNGVDRLSVHLQPAELGSVDIQLTFDGPGRLSALITAERPETLELLQRDSRILERSLGDSGLKLASDGLSFVLKQDHPQQQHHQQSFHEQAQARQTAFRANDAYDGTAESEPAPSTQRVVGLRLLDIET